MLTCTVHDIIDVNRTITIHYGFEVMPLQVPAGRGVARGVVSIVNFSPVYYLSEYHLPIATSTSKLCTI